jgi:hypothetical protein
MLTLLLPILGGAISGAMAACLVAGWTLRRWRRGSRPASPPPVIDPQVLSDIDQAAKAWASSHGQPETAAGLVADKLRLVYELTQRRNRP